MLTEQGAVGTQLRLRVLGMRSFTEMLSELGLGSQVVVGPVVKELTKRRSHQEEGTACLLLGSKLLQSEGMFFALF